jgi:hypothetical protein
MVSAKLQKQLDEMFGPDEDETLSDDGLTPDQLQKLGDAYDRMPINERRKLKVAVDRARQQVAMDEERRELESQRRYAFNAENRWVLARMELNGRKPIKARE